MGGRTQCGALQGHDLCLGRKRELNYLHESWRTYPIWCGKLGYVRQAGEPIPGSLGVRAGLGGGTDVPDIANPGRGPLLGTLDAAGSPRSLVAASSTSRIRFLIQVLSDGVINRSLSFHPCLIIFCCIQVHMWYPWWMFITHSQVARLGTARATPHQQVRSEE